MDTKWTEVNNILDHPLMTASGGNRRKLIVFTEPSDTINYLTERTVSVTRNEILTALNAPDAFVRAIAQTSNGMASEPRYVRRPFAREPNFGATSVTTYKLAELLARAEAPS